MLLNHLGRGSPANPGWIGVRTCARVDSASAKPDTLCGPPPPCKTRMGRPLPRSSIRTVNPSAKVSIRVLGGEGGKVLIYQSFLLGTSTESVLKPTPTGWADR